MSNFYRTYIERKIIIVIYLFFKDADKLYIGIFYDISKREIRPWHKTRLGVWPYWKSELLSFFVSNRMLNVSYFYIV